jgi:hypothetical protein
LIAAPRLTYGKQGGMSMFENRGVWLPKWQSVRYAQGTHIRISHSARLARICGFLTLLVLSASAHASYSYTQDPQDICATEAIYLDASNPRIQGVTESGIGYTVTQSEALVSYSGRYSAFNPQHASLTIRFDKPMAAVGAVLVVSGYGSYTSEPTSNEGIYVSENGYRGVVASGGSIQEVCFITNNGPLSAIRVDIRPLPVAAPDNLQVFENSAKVYDPGTLLLNDLHADGAVLVQAPLHSQRFELSEDGSFTYQPAKDFEGPDSFSYRATNGFGASKSDPVTVDINVLHVNCAPEFTKGPDVNCLEDDSLQTLPQWATLMEPGTDLESDQHVTWDISTDRPDLFSQGPALSLDGTLSYQPALYKAGTATVTLRLHDDGGTENGGKDTSEPQTFAITIEPRAHAPMIEPIMDCAVRAGDALILSAKATEMDTETSVTYSLETAPEGASIDSLTGQIIWRPNESAAGQMPTFMVKATRHGDSEDLNDTTTFHVEVLGQARPPQIKTVDDIETKPGEMAATKIATRDGGNMRYFLATAIPGAMLNPTTGEFHWQPSATDAGRTVTFSVTAVDLASPNLCAMKTFSVHVGNSLIALKKASIPRALLVKNKSLQTTGQAAMRFAQAPKPRAKKG